MPIIKGLLFDLDGTLVDSAPDLAVAINRMCSDLGRGPLDEKSIRDWIGNGASVLVKRALSNSRDVSSGLDESMVAEALKRFMLYYRETLCVHSRLYPGVAQTLRHLQASNHLLAVVTNKPEALIAPLLGGLGIADCFALTVGGDTLPRKKPNPMPLEYAVDQLGLRVEQCLMVGDSRNDIQAAKALGMRSIGVSYGYNYGESIQTYQPEAVAEHFAEIVEILGKGYLASAT
jgi:phosphoglycolate phosphatase